MPNLSLKERLALEKHLPMKTINPKRLRDELGYYLNGDDPDGSTEQLEQYAEFHEFLPIFTKIIP
jgi:hypothetical protein